MSKPSISWRWMRSHHSWRLRLIPAMKSGKSRAEAMWMVTRIMVACTMRRCSSARVSASRSNPFMRDHSATYGEGAYCVWSPPTRSTTVVSGSRDRSSNSWRARSARLRSRLVRTRSFSGLGGSAYGLQDDHWELAGRLLLVGREAGHDLLLLAPDPVSFLALGDTGPDLASLCADLDGGPGVGLEVVEPVGVRGSTSLR